MFQIDAEENSAEYEVTVEVIKYTEEELTVQVSSEKTEAVFDEDICNSNVETETQKSSEKFRTMSESSLEEVVCILTCGDKL